MDSTVRKVLRTIAVLVIWLPVGCHNDGVQPDGPAPTLTSLSPAEGTVGTEVHIVGNDFRSGASVSVGGTPATSVDVASSTDLYAFVPDGVVAGTPYDVEVHNTDGTSATLPAAFTAIAPDLRFVNSATKPSGNSGSTVILEGDAFGDLQGDGQVLFSDGVGGTIAATIASPGDWTNTFIVTTVPSAAQDGPVTVTTATGTSESLPFKVTQNAAFSPSTIFWTETTSMPEALSGHSALYVPIEDPTGATIPRVYVVGGRRLNGELSAQVHHAVIQEAGGLDTWVSATGLDAPRAYASVVAATPFNSKVPGAGRLFIIGGIDDTGAPTTSVLSAELDSVGNVAAPVAATPLPVPLHSMGAVVFRSHIYVAGGATTGDAPVATVYRAAIDTLGALGEWVELESLPSPRASHGFQTFGGFLYAVGGDGDAVAPDDGATTQPGRLDQIAYAKINLRTGDLSGSWSINAASLGKVRSKHSALAAGGNMFVSAGLYSAAQQGSSENTYAQINSDGTVGSFGGATGSNTLQSVGAGNLFNHAAIVYVDGAGQAHVMILGGDSVNAPGTRSAKVFYY
ncbi:MAG: IPT/TIG domain-containing protein [Gemmatimonadota bacterium]|jgi:hypothetical protein